MHFSDIFRQRLGIWGIFFIFDEFLRFNWKISNLNKHAPNRAKKGKIGNLSNFELLRLGSLPTDQIF